MAKLTTERRAYLFDLYGPYICNGEEDDFRQLRTLIADNVGGQNKNNDFTPYDIGQIPLWPED